MPIWHDDDDDDGTSRKRHYADARNEKMKELCINVCINILDAYKGRFGHIFVAQDP